MKPSACGARLHAEPGILGIGDPADLDPHRPPRSSRERELADLRRHVIGADQGLARPGPRARPPRPCARRRRGWKYRSPPPPRDRAAPGAAAAARWRGRSAATGGRGCSRPPRGRPSARASSSSAAVCASTRVCSPIPLAAACRSRSAARSSAATMSSAASAPAARASQSWYSSTVKSFRSTGTGTAARAATRSSRLPPNQRASVSTDTASAPAAA